MATKPEDAPTQPVVPAEARKLLLTAIDHGWDASFLYLPGGRLVAVTATKHDDEHNVQKVAVHWETAGGDHRVTLAKVDGRQSSLKQVTAVVTGTP